MDLEKLRMLILPSKNWLPLQHAVNQTGRKIYTKGPGHPSHDMTSSGLAIPYYAYMIYVLVHCFVTINLCDRV